MLPFVVIDDPPDLVMSNFGHGRQLGLVVFDESVEFLYG